MQNSQGVWEVYLTCKTWGCRPSELLDVADRYAAYCLDSAVGIFGRTLESELNSVEGKNPKQVATKRDRTLKKWLGIELEYRGPSRADM